MKRLTPFALCAYTLLTLVCLGAPQSAFAQNTPPAAAPGAAPAPAPAATPAAKELVQKILALQRQLVERMALQMVEQPALQLLQAALPAVQRLPADKREATAREIQADARKYVEDTYPGVRDRAVALMPSTMAPLLEERMTEEELREVLRILESPANRKFQALAPELAQAIQKALVEQSRSGVEARLRSLEQSVARRVSPAPAASAPTPGANPPAKK